MFGSFFKRASAPEAVGGAGSNNGTGEVMLGGNLPQRPGAVLPPRREGHSNSHPHHPSTPHRNGAPHHGNGSGVGNLTAPQNGRIHGIAVEVSMILPAILATNREGQPATTVAVHCDKHLNGTPFVLTRQVDGAWQGKLPVPERTSWIHYYFKVDGDKVVLDPSANRAKDDTVEGGYVNVRQARH